MNYGSSAVRNHPQSVINRRSAIVVSPEAAQSSVLSPQLDICKLLDFRS